MPNLTSKELMAIDEQLSLEQTMVKSLNSMPRLALIRS